MNIFAEMRASVEAVLQDLIAAGDLPATTNTGKVTVEPPRDPAHGDMATNAAMVLAKAAGMKPRDLAEKIAAGLDANDRVTSVEIAGPGFINLRLSEAVWPEVLRAALGADTAFGDSALGRGGKVNVEYVSANPTGLLHVGHARGAVFGDALAALLEKAGFAVTREYYINDAGKQVEILGESLIKRIRELQGEVLPDDAFEGLYPGEEVIDAAKVALADGKVPNDLDAAADWARDFAVEFMMDRVREDLAALGIKHDIFFSERSLVADGKVDAALKALTGKGLIYEGVLEPPKGKLPDDWEERPQTLFKSSEFGDDIDRPLKKSDGSWTYFASDIAYHLDKYNRGFATMIDVWGADHGGYVKRVQAAVKALTDGAADLDIKLCQLVHLFNKGEPVRMSKRAGTVITVRDVVEEVGRDVVRFIMLTRKNDAPLDFDYAKVTEQSKDNPVFYVQYAHARSHSAFRQAQEAFPDTDFGDTALQMADLDCLTDSGERRLMQTIAEWPRIIESAAEAHEPHRLAFYLYDLAADFHGHWTRGKDQPELRFIVEDNVSLTTARLALVRGVRAVIASGLDLFGVKPVEEMR